jgi:hypothetical protein
MSWGNKLLITFIVFASGMGYLVYRSTHVNFELVEKDYYKSELRYQEVIDATNHVNKLSSKVKLTQQPDGILLELPGEMKGRNITGDIFFYCAYDEKKDKRVAMSMDTDGRQLIGANSVKPGNYNVKISWALDGKNYFSENKMMVR